MPSTFSVMTQTTVCHKDRAVITILLFQNKTYNIWLIKVSALPLPSLKLIGMANHKATKKDVRQAAKRRERNKYYGKTTRNAIRDLKAVTGKEADEKLPLVASMIAADAQISRKEKPSFFGIFIDLNIFMDLNDALQGRLRAGREAQNSGPPAHSLRN